MFLATNYQTFHQYKKLSIQHPFDSEKTDSTNSGHFEFELDYWEFFFFFVDGELQRVGAAWRCIEQKSCRGMRKWVAFYRRTNTSV